VVMESINVVIDDESTTDHNEGEQAELNDTQTGIFELIPNIPNKTRYNTFEDIQNTPQLKR
jgi:ERCC4-type nuclease